MKVLDVYYESDLDLISCYGMSIRDMMDNFFSKFPSSYRENYDKNIATIQMYLVDEMRNVNDSAQYYPGPNVLMFESFVNLPHELMHLASSDRINKQFAFCRDGEFSFIEGALIEGMTEYLSCIAKESVPDYYLFECFVVSMLSSIDGIFKPFFIPNYREFISLFPNERDICSLLYSLDYYQDCILLLDDDVPNVEIDRIGNSVKSTIDSLIDIELSFNKDRRERKIYSDKFMDLISDSNLSSLVGYVCPEYLDYAYHEVKKRLLRRSR